MVLFYVKILEQHKPQIEFKPKKNVLYPVGSLVDVELPCTSEEGIEAQWFCGVVMEIKGVSRTVRFADGEVWQVAFRQKKWKVCIHRPQLTEGIIYEDTDKT
jgi:hypothetical protein